MAVTAAASRIGVQRAEASALFAVFSDEPKFLSEAVRRTISVSEHNHRISASDVSSPDLKSRSSSFLSLSLDSKSKPPSTLSVSSPENKRKNSSLLSSIDEDGTRYAQRILSPRYSTASIAEELQAIGFSPEPLSETQLNLQLRKYGNRQFALSFISLFFMVLQKELLWNNGSPSLTTDLLKAVVSLCSIALAWTTVSFYRIRLRIQKKKHHVPPTANLVTGGMFQPFFIEMLLCAIHTAPYIDRLPGDVENVVVFIMFFRMLYLVRILILNSQLFTPAGRLIGVLTQVEFSPEFVIRTVLFNSPWKFMIVFYCIMLFVNSYSMFQFERLGDLHDHSVWNDSDMLHFRNALWCLVITSLTVGYGDQVPRTDLGRLVAVFTAVCGTIITALMVALIHNNLELTMQQTKVVQFLKKDTFRKGVKDAAVRAIQSGWRLHRARMRSGNPESWSCSQLRRRMYQEILHWRRIKRANLGNGGNPEGQYMRQVTIVEETFNYVRDLIRRLEMNGILELQELIFDDRNAKNKRPPLNSDLPTAGSPSDSPDENGPSAQASGEAAGTASLRQVVMSLQTDMRQVRDQIERLMLALDLSAAVGRLHPSPASPCPTPATASKPPHLVALTDPNPASTFPSPTLEVPRTSSPSQRAAVAHVMQDEEGYGGARAPPNITVDDGNTRGKIARLRSSVQVLMDALTLTSSPRAALPHLDHKPKQAGRHRRSSLPSSLRFLATHDTTSPRSPSPSAPCSPSCSDADGDGAGRAAEEQRTRGTKGSTSARSQTDAAMSARSAQRAIMDQDAAVAHDLTDALRRSIGHHLPGSVSSATP